VGCIKIFFTLEDLEERRQLVTRQQADGLSTRMLSPQEACEIEPAIPASQIVGAAFCADDGICSPGKVCAAFVSAAVRMVPRADARRGLQGSK